MHPLAKNDSNISSNGQYKIEKAALKAHTIKSEDVTGQLTL